MRRLLALGAALLVALAASAVAGAQTIGAEGIQLASDPAAAKAGVGDAHGTGAGRTTAGMLHFELSAHQRLTRDFGQVSVRLSAPTGQVSYRVDLDCVHLHPLLPHPASQPPNEKGVLGGVVRDVTPVPNVLGVVPGQRRFTFIQDGGNRSGGAPVDTFVDVLGAVAPQACKITFLLAGPLNVEQGNVNIKLPD
jgi:hypothetical protein